MTTRALPVTQKSARPSRRVPAGCVLSGSALLVSAWLSALSSGAQAQEIPEPAPSRMQLEDPSGVIPDGPVSALPAAPGDAGQGMDGVAVEGEAVSVLIGADGGSEQVSMHYPPPPAVPRHVQVRQALLLEEDLPAARGERRRLSAEERNTLHLELRHALRSAYPRPPSR